MQFLSLYFHIPFCRQRCSYCAFNIYTDLDALKDTYVDAVGQEIRWLARGEKVHTVYLGGGTPSLLTPAQVEKILTAVRESFALVHPNEITFEANPGKVTQAYFEALFQLGVNRLSLGMQSAHAAELTLFGRDHTVSDTARSMEMARRAGFENISLDLIYGVPFQTLEMWQHTLTHALNLHPDHFSLYALQVESGTEIARRIKYGGLPAPDDDLTADMYEAASDMLTNAGFEQYEISSWGKKQSLHNLQYWYNLPYLGLGAGAHGYAAGQRTVNVMRPEKYIERLTQQTTALIYPRTAATQSIQPIDRDDEMFETVMLRLRLLREGLPRVIFEQRFGQSLESRYGKIIHKLKSQGLLEEKADTLYLTPQARLISNRVFEAFLPEKS
ncbi:MAG: radical SAM family heme chaperone HemW [Anaerolineae bacterium]|nr:radical SAM family heme chaperone HemW [Anaerolineae bacterium]